MNLYHLHLSSFLKQQKKFKEEGEFRLKEFFVHKGEAIHLVSMRDDLSFEWAADGVALTGMTEAELSAAIV